MSLSCSRDVTVLGATLTTIDVDAAGGVNTADASPVNRFVAAPTRVSRRFPGAAPQVWLANALSWITTSSGCAGILDSVLVTRGTMRHMRSAQRLAFQKSGRTANRIP